MTLFSYLAHFLLIGAVLFGVYSLTPAGSTLPAASRQIRLSYDELAQLVLLFKSQWRHEPTAEEFNRLVEDKVQGEILYREALAMGLDRDDEIVKRRMSQKIQFLAEDVAAAREPTSAQLRAWYEKNSASFAQPTRVSFRHLYFSPDRRGARAREDAAQALAKLAGQPEDAKIAASLADRFMFQDHYRDRARLPASILNMHFVGGGSDDLTLSIPHGGGDDADRVRLRVAGEVPGQPASPGGADRREPGAVRLELPERVRASPLARGHAAPVPGASDGRGAAWSVHDRCRGVRAAADVPGVVSDGRGRVLRRRGA